LDVDVAKGRRRSGDRDKMEHLNQKRCQMMVERS
jgi:hypothetical protein